MNVLEGTNDVPLLGAEYMQALAEIKADEPVPFVAYAGIEAAMFSCKIIDGFARNIIPNRVNCLKSKKDQSNVKQANKIIRDARDLGKSLKIENRGGFLREASFFRVRLFCFLVKIAKPWFEDRTWNSMVDIEQELIKNEDPTTGGVGKRVGREMEC